jgi:GGDEF domain-containing protein
VEPIERRPDAAVRTLRSLAAEARLLLFGQPGLEPVSRKMLEFGCDDYLVTPTTAAELGQIFSSPMMRAVSAPTSHDESTHEAAPAASKLAVLDALSLYDILMDALLHHPADSVTAAVSMVNSQVTPTMQIVYAPKETAAPVAPEGQVALSLPVRSHNEEVACVHLLLPQDEDQSMARHFLAQLSQLLGKLASLQDRHNRLQKLAITDDLTGLYNGRYFRQFLSKIVERAREMRFPVTLLLFDIDDFKRYNDQYGHGVGDEILKQTAVLMKRCVRDHDLVARISGDEFAVVFWEKDTHRQPRDPTQGTPGRPPQTPIQIFQRFQKLLATPDFTVIGPMAQGSLTISGGLAVFPYDASTAADLITAADNKLMFGAKAAGKNSLHLTGPQAPLNGSH